MKRRLLFLVVIALFLGLSKSSVQAETSTIDGLSYNTHLFVREDGVIEITNDVTVYFNQSQQGIFVAIPQLYTNFDVSGWTGVKGETRTYFFRVSDFSSNSHEFVEDDNTSTRNRVFRLGTAGRFLTGEHTFTYSYRIHTQDLHLGLDKDVFFMNIIGSGWNFDFEQVSFSIEFEGSLPETFPIEIQGGSSSQTIPFVIQNNTIVGEYGPIRTGESITVLADLPLGFFTFPPLDFTIYGLGLLGVSFVLFLVLFMRHGKDYPLVETVEFTAPDNFSSAEAAYIFKGHVSHKDVTSLIIFWASHGFLEIEELEDDVIRLIKRRDIQSHNVNEMRLFNVLFENRESVTTTELADSFAKNIVFAVQSIPHYFKHDKSRWVFDKQSTLIKGLTAIGLVVAVGIYFGLVTHATYGSLLFSMITFGVVSAMSAGVVIVFGIYLPRYRNQNVAGKFSKIIALFAIYSMFFVAVCLVIMLLGVRVNITHVSIVAVLFGLSLFLVGNMDRRTQQGMRWYGQILGLKRFIEVAEHDRLLKLVEETPSLFYDILPFAYVLGVTDIWSNKFESIAIERPDWYHSSSVGDQFNSLMLWTVLSHSMNSIQTSMITQTISDTSSGGGFGGGGASGGGFSGGGFGGGGGGGW